MGEYLKSTELPAVLERIQEMAKIHAMNTQSKGNSFPLRPSSALKSDLDLYLGLCNYFAPGSIPRDPVEGRNAMLLSLGHDIERHFIAHIERAYAIGNRNMRVTYGEVTLPNCDKYKLSGEFDFEVVSAKTGERIICDSKSSADYPFKSGDMPKNSYLAQINLYLHSTYARENNINKAWICVYNKNNSEIRIFEFEYSRERALEIIRLLQKIPLEFRAKPLYDGRMMKANKRINNRVRISSHEADEEATIVEVTGLESFSVDGDTVRIALKNKTLFKLAEFAELLEEGRAFALEGKVEV